MSDNLTQDHVSTEPVDHSEEANEAVEPASSQVTESSQVNGPSEPDDTVDGTADDAPAAPTQSNRRANLEREGEVAADFLETLLDICDLDGDIDVDIDGDRAAVAIVDSEEGRVPRRLVGRDGEVLEALQELTRLAVYRETGERSRLMLDISGYRSDKRAELEKLAEDTVAQVRESGAPASLDPMTPFERKVVHDAVAAAGLTSESEGVEPRRFVVVLPA